MPRKATTSGDKKPTIVKKLPTTEYGAGVHCITRSGAGVHCITRSGKEYQISQCPEKNRHTLWKVVDGGYEKVSTADSPHDLYALIDWEK